MWMLDRSDGAETASVERFTCNPNIQRVLRCIGSEADMRLAAGTSGQALSGGRPPVSSRRSVPQRSRRLFQERERRCRTVTAGSPFDSNICIELRRVSEWLYVPGGHAASR